jgi:Protein of unknown function (DUF2800)
MTAQRAHSKLGASSAKRWMTCPGSVREVARRPAPPTSKAASAGTHAHAWCELMLQRRERMTDEHVGMTANGRVDEPPLTREDVDAINVYIDHVEQFAALPDAELEVERRLQLTEIDAELFGTNDACVYLAEMKHLHVFDYKHGASVVVRVENNPQLLYYAYGAWMGYREAGVERITLHVVQPRAAGDAIKSFDVDPFELVEWSYALEKAAKATRAPDAPLVPGEHCRSTFCANAPFCEALRSKAQAAATDGFGKTVDPVTLAPDELGTRLRDVRILKAYIAALEDYADREAFAGRPPKGWKLVQGSGRRVWSPDKSEQDIATAIARVSNAVDPWEKSLLSVAAAEKALGKKTFATLESVVTKKPGNPQLVPSEDRRPEWTGGDGFTPITE